jgi:hypothetical protein
MWYCVVHLNVLRTSTCFTAFNTVDNCGEAFADILWTFSFQVGDRIAMEPGIACNVCTACKEGRYNLCEEMKFFATPPVHGSLANEIVHPAGACPRLRLIPTFVSQNLILFDILGMGLSFPRKFLACEYVVVHPAISENKCTRPSKTSHVDATLIGCAHKRFWSTPPSLLCQSFKISVDQAATASTSWSFRISSSTGNSVNFSRTICYSSNQRCRWRK